jgi:hypothetical protein
MAQHRFRFYRNRPARRRPGERVTWADATESVTPEEIVGLEAESVRWWERWRKGLVRPALALTGERELCREAPVDGLSGCVRLEGHRGLHVVAGLTPWGARFHVVVAGELADFAGDPVFVDMKLPYRQPTRRELAEEWAGYEEFSPNGKAVVGG